MTALTSVLSATLSVAPSSPERGDTYIVADGATGVWTGKDDDLATWGGASWSYLTPADGNLVWDAEINRLRVYTSGAWDIIGSQCANVMPSVFEISDPPTQAEVQGALDTLVAVIASLKGSSVMAPNP